MYMDGVTIMPKQTFFNLSESKKKNILHSAIDEFAEYDYNSASINRIVDKANIAKGSFYQYFNDKLDLFSYVTDHIAAKKMEYFSKCDILKKTNMDFFIYLKALFEKGVSFGIENPKFFAIGAKLYKNDALRKKIYIEMEEKAHNFMKQLIIQGQANGNVKKNINLDLATYLLVHLNFSMAEIYFKTNDKEKIHEFHKLTDDMIDILKNGINSPNNNQET